MSIHRLEELSMRALDALPRERTLVILTVSPLEEHGPHLPLGVDAFTAEHFARELAARLVASRPDWSVVIAPTLHCGAFTMAGVGTIHVRQRVVRDVVVDYGESLARAGFRHLLIANGHGGPGHLTALEEAAAIVSRRRGVMMASLSGRLACQFRAGRFLERVAAAMGRPLTDAERRAFGEDAHAGWWETSMMLWLRPELVDGGYRTLPSATYSLPERLIPGYALRRGGGGYMGHPALGDPAFAKASCEILVDEALRLVQALLDGRERPAAHRSPFFRMPFLRTNFWPAAAAAGFALAALAWLTPRRAR